jgi:hypothetical protein
MNLNYLIDTIIPQREKEIEEGKNAGTRQPIYVVLDLQEHAISGHTDYSLITNHKGKRLEHGYIDLELDSESREFNIGFKRMLNPEKVTRFWTDKIIAFFLTRKAAEEYMEYQRHNLRDAYIYTFYSGYRNLEMDSLLNDK